jgi:hypothetical protein
MRGILGEKCQRATVSDTTLINLLSLQLGYGMTSRTTAVERLIGLLELENDEVWLFEQAVYPHWVHTY